ncbi:MAG: PBP1A family penicillin-binding protein [Gemmatimonadota bacterium]|nr:PBP1A family penicillin-binding protein [Gemmatimonadota bacterium]
MTISLLGRPVGGLFVTVTARSRIHLGVWAASLVAVAAISAPLSAQAMQVPNDAWRLVQPKQSSLVFGRDNSLIGEIGNEWRTSIALRALPKYVPQAFVAIEDHRFYSHDGVDVVGIAAAIKDKLTGRGGRGASTITQLLVGNMHPDLVDRRDKSLGRKLREQAAALEMETHYSKELILEAFLNQINFGHNWFGIESAARHYFGKPASRLTLAEAASLASMPKSPVIYDPARNPEKNRQRRNIVLEEMAKQGFITADQAAAAKAEPVVTVKNSGMSAPSSYFIDVVRRQAEHEGIPVANGGFRIYTTADPLMQRAATESLLEEIARIEGRPGYKHQTLAKHAKGSTDFLQGAVVALDAQTGDVLALVGGRDFLTSPFNRAVFANRQPGSAIKPVVYAAAIADSIPANTIVPDTALAIPMDNGQVYRPDDADGMFLGAMTIREALAKSRNSVAVQLGLRVGIDSVAAFARHLGIESPVALYPSSAIGASVVKPIELVAAYSAFADTGSIVTPRFIRRIDDMSGRAVLEPQTQPLRPAIDPRVAFIVRDLMTGTVAPGGTASGVRAIVPARIPVAGKTGTTNDNTDVWFVGVTPEIVAGVWLGFDTPKTITPGAAGGSYAAPVWAKMVARWYERRSAGAWDAPPAGMIQLQMDRQSGQLATDLTPPERRYTEYFIAGTEPLVLRITLLDLFVLHPVTIIE